MQIHLLNTSYHKFFSSVSNLHKILIITYKYNMKKIDIKKLLIYILVPLLSGVLVGIITSGDMKSYNGFVPGWIFPVVWSILYILMGISSYLVRDNEEAINVYKTNLVINLAWTFIFFTFKMKILAFIWILLLIVIVSYMIYKFFKVKRLAAYLQIPYLLWLIFASILNLIEIL